MPGIVAALSHALVAAAWPSGPLARLEGQSAEPRPPIHREYPLNCRGGAGLVFDTLDRALDSGRVRLSLTFSASLVASGPEGQGLAPGTCAWVDRPLGAREPRRIHVSIGAGDTTPRLSMLDDGVYWGFLASTSDSGYIDGVGYRHWHAASPPAATAAPPATSRRRLPLPFDVRYLPLVALGMVVVVGVPGTMLVGRWSGWRRLAERYPDRNAARGRPFRSGPLVMRRTVYRMGVRFTMDESYLHVAVSALVRPGHPPFSVPWSDIQASRDEWPWFPFRRHPVVRLALAGLPDLRILIQVRDGKRIAEASGGRLDVGAQGDAQPTARSPSS